MISLPLYFMPFSLRVNKPSNQLVLISPVSLFISMGKWPEGLCLPASTLAMASPPLWPEYQADKTASTLF